MRILIINTMSHTGSTGKIAYGLHNYLQQLGNDVLLCCRGPKEERINDSTVIELISKTELYFSVLLSRLTGKEGNYSFFATRKLIKIINNYKPDLIQLYNLHGNYINHNHILRFISQKNIPAVYSMLDEFAYMGKCPFPGDCQKFMTKCYGCYQKKEYPMSLFFDRSAFLFKEKKKTYSLLKRIVFTGPNFVCKRASKSALLHDKKLETLYEPFDMTTSFYPRVVHSLRQRLDIRQDQIVIVSAPGTRPRKGGKQFVELAKLLSDDDRFIFIFIGYNRNDWVFSKNVIVRGFIHSPDELAEYLSLADLYICTSLGDTTPSVCLAALACGTPLAGFDYGGVVDCAPNEYGKYVPIGDIQALVNVIKCTQPKSEELVNKIRSYALNKYSPEIIYSKQLEIYKKIVYDSF